MFLGECCAGESLVAGIYGKLYDQSGNCRVSESKIFDGARSWQVLYSFSTESTSTTFRDQYIQKYPHSPQLKQKFDRRRMIAFFLSVRR